MLYIAGILLPFFTMLFIGSLIAERHDKKEESPAAGKQARDSEKIFHLHNNVKGA